MKVYKEVSGRYDFDFWSGARDTVKYLTDDEVEQIFEMLDEVEQIFEMLEEIYPEGIDETTVNDFFWFEDETIAEWLGYDSFEDIMNRDD